MFYVLKCPFQLAYHVPTRVHPQLCAGEMFINDVAKAPKQAMQALSAKTDAVGSSEWVRSGCGLVFLPGLAD